MIFYMSIKQQPESYFHECFTKLNKQVIIIIIYFLVFVCSVLCIPSVLCGAVPAGLISAQPCRAEEWLKSSAVMPSIGAAAATGTGSDGGETPLKPRCCCRRTHGSCQTSPWSGERRVTDRWPVWFYKLKVSK